MALLNGHKPEARVIARLEEGPATVAEIYAATAISPNYIRCLLYQLKRENRIRGVPVGTGRGNPMLWSLKRGDA